METKTITAYANEIINLGGTIVPFTIINQVREAVRDLDPRHRTPCGGAFVLEQHAQVLYID